MGPFRDVVDNYNLMVDDIFVGVLGIGWHAPSSGTERCGQYWRASFQHYSS